MAAVENLLKPRVGKLAKSDSIIKRQAVQAKANVVAYSPRVKKTSSPAEALTIYQRMGRLLGKQIKSELDVVKIVNLGLPSSALDLLIAEIGVDIRLIGSETTVRRRMQEKQHFTVDESERLVRLARITAMAEALFGGTQAATAWLSRRSDYLPGSEPVSPLELSATDSGARVVESMMLQTAHGIF